MVKIAVLKNKAALKASHQIPAPLHFGVDLSLPLFRLSLIGGSVPDAQRRAIFTMHPTLP